MSKPKKKELDYIMDHFNFSRVQKVMDFVGWKWAMFDEPSRVPNECELRECARDLLNRADESGGWISTGGFTAGYDDGRVYLNFTLVEEEVWRE